VVLPFAAILSVRMLRRRNTRWLTANLPIYGHRRVVHRLADGRHQLHELLLLLQKILQVTLFQLILVISGLVTHFKVGDVRFLQGRWLQLPGMAELATKRRLSLARFIQPLAQEVDLLLFGINGFLVHERRQRPEVSASGLTSDELAPISIDGLITRISSQTLAKLPGKLPLRDGQWLGLAGSGRRDGLGGGGYRHGCR